MGVHHSLVNDVKYSRFISKLSATTSSLYQEIHLSIKMVVVKQYHLKPTPLIPNSPYPLLYYPNILSTQLITNSNIAPRVQALFQNNGWHTQWIYRYGSTQQSHYHSKSHECMAVLSGKATIRFGAADTTTNLNESTWGGKHEGGVEIKAEAGDVFLIPAGVAHKTFDTSPAEEFALLTPGDGSGIEAENVQKALCEVKLSGFTMLGAYPVDGEWDFATGGEDAGNYEGVWAIERPQKDPVMGRSEEGLCGVWRNVDMSWYQKGSKRKNESFDGLKTEFDGLAKAKL